MTQMFMLLLLIKLIDSKIIRLKYERVADSLNVRFSLAGSNIQKYFELDMKINMTWTGLTYYNEEPSTKHYHYGVISEFLKHENVQYQLISDTLKFEEDQGVLDEFFIIHMKASFYEYDTMTLSYQFFDNRTSLVWNLYKKKMIEHFQFGLLHKNDKGGYLYIGGFPKEITDNKYHSSCSVNKNAYTWSCSFQYALINNKTIYKNSSPSYFQTSQSRLLVPHDFFELLKKEFFNIYEEQKYCHYSEIFKIAYYMCTEEVTKMFPNITLIIEDKEYSFSYHELTENYGGMYRFFLTINQDEPKQWVLGQLFLKKYPSLFDYEEGKVIMYSDVPFKTVIIKESSNILLRLILMTLGLCLLDLFFLLIYKYYITFKLFI